jgi:HD-GYP domain-containing protein (c-di-GMP phosphodiesterase class II)
MIIKFPVYVIALGALIMLASIIKYSKLFKFPLNLDDNRHRQISIIIKINFIMMIFFFFGYISVAGMLLNNHHMTDLLTALIFLFGSLFVFSVIFIQIEVGEVINEIYSFHTVESLVNTIEAKDKYTKGHSKHVSNLCECIHEHLPNEKRKNINTHLLRYAGYLHDIGKIGVADTILNKNGPLNDEEWKAMKTHPEIGRSILASNFMLSNLGDWIYYHHERIDGNGYYGLKGEDIPFESKIICLADCFSAITTDRIYHKGKSYNEAIEILKEVSGSQLDEELVAIFLKIPREKIEKCIP